jgi:hypothetical protein
VTRVRFLDSDHHGEPAGCIEPVPAGTPNVWLALDTESQKAVLFLWQCATMVSNVRDTHRVFPLAFVSSIDGLRIALAGIEPVMRALDQPKPHDQLTDDDFLLNPPDRKAEAMQEVREGLKKMTPDQRIKAIDMIRALEGDVNIPPEYRHLGSDDDDD